MRLITGLILIACGIAIIKYRYQIHDFTGDWAWTYKYFGGNGTIIAIVLIGMMLIGVGTVYPFGYVNLTPQTRIIVDPASGSR